LILLAIFICYGIYERQNGAKIGGCGDIFEARVEIIKIKTPTEIHTPLYRGTNDLVFFRGDRGGFTTTTTTF
jgi:hypothetical protein